MSASNELCVDVDLGARRYDIIIGEDLLRRLSSYVAPIVGRGKIHVISDQTVFDLHGDKLESIGAPFSQTILPPGEAQKSFETLQRVLDDMFEANLSRTDTVIAFGGGVIGDLAGFAASLYKRGCQFIQVPTTLLAQVDSSVGGKTAINVPRGKNLVGAFYQPRLVLSDTSVLATLPERQVQAGYAEVLKYGLLGDSGFFKWLEEKGQDVLRLDPKAVNKAVAISCETKARIVANDEHERGQRALLNLGHTFGHALETQAGYGGDLLHGEAVSVGMEMAFDFCVSNGMCSEIDAKNVSAHLKLLGLKTIADVTHLIKPDDLMQHMEQDKKNQAGRLTLIMVRAIGEAYVNKDVDRQAVKAYLNRLT